MFVHVLGGISHMQSVPVRRGQEVKHWLSYKGDSDTFPPPPTF